MVDPGKYTEATRKPKLQDETPNYKTRLQPTRVHPNKKPRFEISLSGAKRNEATADGTIPGQVYGGDRKARTTRLDHNPQD